VRPEGRARLEACAGSFGNPIAEPLRQMILVAGTVVQTATARTESRGAHQREDFPATEEARRLSQLVEPCGETPGLSRLPVAA
jgi:succinate dehydrogenase / fumarate reductase flavoprotein subunit